MKKKELKIRFHHDDKGYCREFWEIFSEDEQTQPCFILRDTWFAPHLPPELPSWEQDNWRDNNRQTIASEVLSRFDFCSDEMQIVRITERHTECGLTWRKYFADWAQEDCSISFGWSYGFEVGNTMK